MKDLEIITGSSMSYVDTCQKKYELRYIDELVPILEPQSLRFGSLVHYGLNILRGGYGIDVALEGMEREVAMVGCDREDFLKAQAMLRGYYRLYGNESKKVFKSEAVFEMPVWNVATGAESRTFMRMGKIDCILLEEDGYWLHEVKTASSISEGYLSRLWLDRQITFYMLGAQVMWDIELRGVVYDVIVKSRLSKKEEELEADFEERRAGLIAKSKTGKTTAKRQMGESEEAFSKRLDLQYEDTQRMFHREKIYIDGSRLEVAEREMWALCDELRTMRKRGLYRRNTDSCWKYNMQCRYWPICSAKTDESRQVIIDNMYTKKPAHQELLKEESEVS